MRSGWLLRDGDVVCALEMADTPADRGAMRGRDGCEGALHLDGARAVHTGGMRFPVDVAFLSGDLTVLRLVTVQPEAGALERWGVCVGDQLEVREAPRDATSERP